FGSAIFAGFGPLRVKSCRRAQEYSRRGPGGREQESEIDGRKENQTSRQRQTKAVIMRTISLGGGRRYAFLCVCVYVCCEHEHSTKHGTLHVLASLSFTHSDNMPMQETLRHTHTHTHTQ